MGATSALLLLCSGLVAFPCCRAPTLLRVFSQTWLWQIVTLPDKTHRPDANLWPLKGTGDTLLHVHMQTTIGVHCLDVCFTPKNTVRGVVAVVVATHVVAPLGQHGNAAGRREGHGGFLAGQGLGADSLRKTTGVIGCEARPAPHVFTTPSKDMARRPHRTRERDKVDGLPPSIYTIYRCFSVRCLRTMGVLRTASRSIFVSAAKGVSAKKSSRSGNGFGTDIVYFVHFHLLFVV